MAALPQAAPAAQTMRFTIVDQQGSMSFVGPCHALKVLAAACSRQPDDHRSLMTLAADYDAGLAKQVLDGLAIFDEHVDPGDGETVRAIVDQRGSEPPFRVLDDVTRRLSLQPGRAGLIVFNLKARRIVQVQNSYADLRRKDRGRLRRDGRPIRALFHYELPPDWSIVP